MSAKLRTARDEDLPLLADVLCMAGRGHLARGPWDFVFPDPAERQRGLARIAGGAERSFCHRSVFRVADLGGVASAALVAFDASTFDEHALGRAMFAAFAALGLSSERSAAVGPLLAPYLACFPDMPRDTWIIENVGTRPEARRRGLVAKLLEDALEEGRRRGFALAQISVLIDNEPALRAYENAGFRVVERRATPEFARLMRAPGFVRMTLALGGGS
ncbi:MAG TPA: GNAT family N-acetyltransferase [Myxococcota bacterium]|nr:GNAT family N-acetyltransferase [Myxococcota bacterium]